MSKKLCQLDLIPTWLVNQCVDQLLPLFISIINGSFTKGEFPNYFKNAIVKPLLKKPSLDKDELKNYRPVSNLHFISKVIEKSVSTRFEEHISEYSMYDPMQSALQVGSLTNSYNILSSLDASKCTVLVSLDLSAVFETINHNVLLNRLHYMYGITGNAFKWFQLYIEQRNNQVCARDKMYVSEYVNILRVTFDNKMTLQNYITNICRPVNIHIRKINSIRRYLSDTAVRTLVQSIVIASLDYCNSVVVVYPLP